VDRRQGKFELASGGTVFLDEIGELPFAAQGKLLRAIEEKVIDRIGGQAPVTIDVRVVAATNRDLKAAIAEGTFRQDLFFRLAVFPVEIPALRDRGDDVILLANHFANQFGVEMRREPATLSEASMSRLRLHRWPGNVRELENAIERACILSDSLILDPEDLGLAPKTGNATSTLGELDLTGSLLQATGRAVELVEKRMIHEALRAHGGNRSRAAEALGISYKTLLTKMKDYGF
jgi:Nif-specific regulatory protein